MAQDKDVTGTYGSAAAARTATYDSDSAKTYGYSDLKETEFKSKTHGVGVGDNICLHGRNFAVMSIVSEGTGEAVIYKVEDEHQETFALKLYFEFSNPKEEPNGETLKRIWTITDPDILKLHDFGVETDKYQGRYCFEISDFAEGGDLFSVSDLKAHYTQSHIEKTIIPEVFNGIKKLHSYKIYHCDLKPWNIFYLDSARTDIVIGDYGSGKAFDLETEKDARKTSTVKGTEAYLSPEQGRGIISEKNDYYSFGIILLHLLYPEHLANDSDLRKVNKEKFERIVERQYASMPIIEYDERYGRLNTLIEGLTLLNHLNRWGAVEVEKWLSGDEVEVKYRGSQFDSVQPVKLGYATIKSSKDFISVVETRPDAYHDLIEDPDTYTTVKSWLDSYRDIPTRKAFDNMVRFYQPLGKEYVNEAMLRFFEPNRPIAIDMHSFKFFTSADIRKDVEAFIGKLDEIWKITALEQLRFHLFQLEFSLRQVQAHHNAQDSVVVSALVEKLYSAFGLVPKPFDSLAAEVPAKINPKKEAESFQILLNLFYTFNPTRSFRDLQNRPIGTLEDLGMFFARNEAAFMEKFLRAERERFLQNIKKPDLTSLACYQFLFEVFKGKATTELELENLTFDKQRKYQVRYRFAKTLNPFLSRKGVTNDLTVRSSGEIYNQKRKVMQSFSAVCEEFIRAATHKHGIATLSAENLATVRSRFRRDSWKRYLSLYKKQIAMAFGLAALVIFIGVISYGIEEKKLHVDTVLGVTWMENSEYQKKYSEEYAKAQVRAKAEYAQTFVSNLRSQQIKFFNGGTDAPGYGQRRYQYQFDTRSTKYIYVEVNFSHSQPKERVNFSIHAIILNGSGVKVNERSWDSYIEPTWSNSYHTMGFGADRVRNWEKGNYTMQIQINGRLIGSQNFAVN
jgi:serine/threonine protein kinase